MNENHFRFRNLTCDILHLRSRQRQQCQKLLREVWAWADIMSKKFTEEEMLLLLDAYQRLPWTEFLSIDAFAADEHCTADEVQGAFSQVLASHLLYLALVGSDDAFYLPGEAEMKGTKFAADLSDKVRVLPAGEAVALQVILECARSVPASIISYGVWWHPAMMLRLLESPGLDWPR